MHYFCVKSIKVMDAVWHGIASAFEWVFAAAKPVGRLANIFFISVGAAVNIRLLNPMVAENRSTLLVASLLIEANTVTITCLMFICDEVQQSLPFGISRASFMKPLSIFAMTKRTQSALAFSNSLMV